jgi:hypothetical protein
MKHGLLGLILLGTISLWAADVAGHYGLRGVMEVGSELMLKPDGSFDYMLAYGAADYGARGTWKLVDGAVLLTSTQITDPPFKLLQATSVKQDLFRVLIKGPNGVPVANMDVLLRTDKGDAAGRTNQEGAAEFPEVRAVREIRLHVPVYDVEGGPFAAEPTKNEYAFQINGEAITQVKFQSEKLKLDGSCLEMRFWDRSKAMRYCK